MKETAWSINSLPISTTSGTSPQLRLFPTIAFNPGDYPFFNMNPEHTCPATVAGTGSVDYLLA